MTKKWTPDQPISEDDSLEIKRILVRDLVRYVLAPLVSETGSFNEVNDLLHLCCWDQLKGAVARKYVARVLATQQLERTQKWSYRLQGPSDDKPWKEDPSASQAYQTASVVLGHMAGSYPLAWTPVELHAEVGMQLPRLPASDYLDMLRLYVHLGMVIEIEPGRFRARQPTLQLNAEEAGVLLERNRAVLHLVGPVLEGAMRKKGMVVAVQGRASEADIAQLQKALADAVRPIIQAFTERVKEGQDRDHETPFYGVFLGVSELFAEPRDVYTNNKDLPPIQRGGKRHKRG